MLDQNGKAGGASSSMAADMQYWCHCAAAFKRIRAMFADRQLCDVTLTCNNNAELKIPAHRLVLSSVSDYFCAMFTNNLAEAHKDEIEINNVEGDVLKALIDFIYTGEIKLNDSNVLSILSAANYLQLRRIITEATSFLISRLDASNCITIRRFAEQQSLLELHTMCQKYMLDHFDEFAANNELLNELSEPELNSLLDSLYLNVANEEIVYETVIAWVSLNMDTRCSLLSGLLAKVKLPLLPASYLTKQIETNKILANCECQSLVLEAATYHMIPEKIFTAPIPRTLPRKSTVGYLLCVGGVDIVKTGSLGSSHASAGLSQSGFIEKYDCRAERWIPLNFSSNVSAAPAAASSPATTGSNHSIASTSSTSLTVASGINANGTSGIGNALRRLQFGVALLGASLYFVGGRDGLKTLNTVECFDIQRDVWTALPQMSTHRHGLQSAFLGNESVLYSVGGHDGWSFLNSVERYDLESKVWTYVASMSCARSTFGIAVLENNLYAIGGRDATACLNSMEHFNPLSNKWVTCASMFKRRGSVGVCCINGLIYAIGGHEAPSTLANSSRYDCGERYDPKIDQWTMISNISRPREAIAVCSLGSTNIYIAGGYDGHKYLNECEKYDPIKNEWTKIQPLNFPRAGACLIHVPPLGASKLTKKNSKKQYSSPKSVTEAEIDDETKRRSCHLSQLSLAEEGSV